MNAVDKEENWPPTQYYCHCPHWPFWDVPFGHSNQWPYTSAHIFHVTLPPFNRKCLCSANDLHGKVSNDRFIGTCQLNSLVPMLRTWHCPRGHCHLSWPEMRFCLAVPGGSCSTRCCNDSAPALNPQGRPLDSSWLQCLDTCKQVFLSEQPDYKQ